MQEDSKTIQFQDLNDVLHNAQLRRSADLGGWFKKFFHDRRPARVQRAVDKNHAAAVRSAALAH